MTPREQASQRIRQAEQALERARAKWSGWSVSIGSYFGTPKEQVLGALSSMESTGLNPWKARASRLAATDQTGWDAWVKQGNDLTKNFADIAQESEWTRIDVIVADTIAKTVADTAQATATVLKSAWSARHWALAVVVLAAVAAVLYLAVKLRG